MSTIGFLSRTACAVVLTAALAGGAAQAATVVFDSGRMDGARKVHIQGIGGVYAAPMLFTGTYGGDEFTDLVAFCVDVYHRITRADYDPDLVYTDELEFTSDSDPAGPTLLTVAQIEQASRLANYGTLAFYNAPTTTSAQRVARFDELAAIQGAIWQVVSGRNVISTDLALDARIDAFSTAAYASLFDPTYGTVGNGIVFLAPENYLDVGSTQAFIIVDESGGQAAIPEPATWALMIAGFGLAGAALRSRRRVAAI